jgi:hypothetical protein
MSMSESATARRQAPKPTNVQAEVPVRRDDRDESPGGAILAAALEYRRRGWSIIPIAVGTKKPPKGIRWKQYQTRLPKEEELRWWFADRDDLGLAVIFGAVSGGLVCRDFDEVAGYRRWERAHPDLARMLPTVETPRGRHVYFQALPEWHVFENLRPMENGEYRGDSGHYCLLPPSQHPDGSHYKWLVPLPEGELPLIEDVADAELFSGVDVTQKAQGRHKKFQVVISPSEAPPAMVRAPASAQSMSEQAITSSSHGGRLKPNVKLEQLRATRRCLPPDKL